MPKVSDYEVKPTLYVNAFMADGSVVKHTFLHDILDDRVMELVFSAIDDKLEELHGLEEGVR